MNLAKQKRIKNPRLLKEIRQKPCAVTGVFGTAYDPIETHHLETVGSGGDDVEWNVLPVRRSHHVPIVHRLGIRLTAEKFPMFEKWLLDHGWYFDEFMRKWRHE